MTRAALGLAVPAALAAATAYGLASAYQHAQAGLVARRRALDPGLLTSLSRRPAWLLAVAGDGVAVVLQGVALRYGAVALVQPLLVIGLPVAVLVSARLERRALVRREVLGLALCTAGLAVLCPATATSPLGSVPAVSTGFVAGAVVAGAVGALLLSARLRPPFAAVATGTAAGLAVGSGSVLLALCAGRVQDLPGLLGSPLPYAAAAVAVLGLLLSQAAFQTGTLGAPFAALSVSEPVVAVALAVLVLHERLPPPLPVRLAALAGAGLAVGGVLALTRAPAADPVRRRGL